MFTRLREFVRKLIVKCPWTDASLRQEVDTLAKLLNQVVYERDGLMAAVGSQESRFQDLYAMSRDWLGALTLLSNGELTIPADALTAIRQGKGGVAFENRPDGSVVLKLTYGDTTTEASDDEQ